MPNRHRWYSDLEETLGRSHGALDVQGADVLPVLLEQGDQEVNGQMDVLDEFILAHLNVANSDIQAQNLWEKYENITQQFFQSHKF